MFSHEPTNTHTHRMSTIYSQVHKYLDSDTICVILRLHTTIMDLTDDSGLKAAAVKAWQGISRQETQHLVMSMSSRF